MIDLTGRSLLSLNDISPKEFLAILDATGKMKLNPLGFKPIGAAGKQVGRFFQKPSTRTKTSFGAGIKEIGAEVEDLDPDSLQIGKRESLEDVVKTLNGYIHMLVARVFEHSLLIEIRKHAKFSVINALSNKFHPCQALGDYYTILELFGGLNNIHLLYVGEGNNVCHSLMLGAAKLGIKITVLCPEDEKFVPDNDVILLTQQIMEITKGSLQIVHDPSKGYEADIVYTDVWASMGDKEKIQERIEIFQPYQVNMEFFLRQRNGTKNIYFMHCLPAEDGREVTTDVKLHPYSVVFQQAENRKHAQKALMAMIFGLKWNLSGLYI